MSNLSQPIQLVLPLAVGETANGSCIGQLDAAEAQAERQAKLEQILGAERTQSEYDAAQATLSDAYCNEALECRFWEEAQGAWVSDGSCRTVPLTGSDGGVRCECDHLTDFVVVKVHPCPTTSSPPAAHRRCVSVQVPSNWDELAASVLEGFHVNVFTWEQARLHGCSYHISPRHLTLTHPTQRLHVLP